MGQTREKGKAKEKGNKRGEQRGWKAFFPAPDRDGPLVKMQVQMEVCKLKTERRVTTEVSKDWFREMLDLILKEKAGEVNRNIKGHIEEATKKTSIWYIQSWISQGKIDEELLIGENETEDRKDRKSYVIKVKELLQVMRRFESPPYDKRLHTWQKMGRLKRNVYTTRQNWM